MDSAGWDERYAKGQTWSLEPNRFFVEFVKAHGLDAPFGSRRAVDLACGEGRNAIWLAQLGWDTTGVDFSQVGIDRAAELTRRANASVRYVVADLQQWHIEPGAWDLIAHVYLHWPSAERAPFLPRVLAGLAPGGALIVVGHDRTNIEHGVGGPQNPDVLTTPDELAALCRAHGLDVVDARIVNRPVATEQGHGGSGDEVATVDAIDHVVVARRAPAA